MLVGLSGIVSFTGREAVYQISSRITPRDVAAFRISAQAVTTEAFAICEAEYWVDTAFIISKAVE